MRTGLATTDGTGRARDHVAPGTDARSRLREIAAGPETPIGPAAGGDPVPVPPALAPLVPGSGLARGTVVAVADAGHLVVALLTHVCAGGGWAAAVGMPSLRPAVADDHLMLVPEADTRWAEVASILAEGVDLLVVRPPARPRPELVRRLTARFRQAGTRGGAAVVVVGPWESAGLRLEVETTTWHGLADGVGHLYGATAQVTARTRAGRRRTVRVWLPAPDGQAAALADVPEPVWTPAPFRMDVASIRNSRINATSIREDRGAERRAEGA